MAVDRHALFAHIGRITVAWNNLHYILAEIYAESDEGHRETVLRKLVGCRSDAKVRELTLSLARKKLQPISGTMFSRVERVCAEADNLSRDRNDVIHTWWIVSPVAKDEVRPNPHLRRVSPTFECSVVSWPLSSNILA